jgi:DNA-binding response OmpR family regulator
MPKRPTSKTVLIIEDEINIQNFLARVLELEGFTVFQTLDGTTGMEIVKNDHVSLVLLDLRLPPGPDGWSVLRQIKKDPGLAAIPVVVLTASAEAAQRRRTLRLGAASYLVKPISARLLIQTVREALKRRTKTIRPARPASLAPG